MKILLSLLIVTTTCCSASVAQEARPASVRSTDDAKFEAAIAIIARSDDAAAVRAATATLRSGGIESIVVLARFVNDERKASPHSLSRAVSGRVSVGDQCFWLIQDQLEDHTSKMDASFSPVSRQNIAEWLSRRSGMSLPQLRREACIGSFRVILEFQKRHPNYDIGRTLRAYAMKLVALDAAVDKAVNKAVNRNTHSRGN